MLAISCILILITVAAASLSINTKEEVVKVSMAVVALLALFITIVVAPWSVKLPIIAIPLFIGKLEAIATKISRPLI